MLIQLSSRGLRPKGPTESTPFLVRVTRDPAFDPEARASAALLLESWQEPIHEGFRAYLSSSPTGKTDRFNAFEISKQHAFLDDGDVVRIDPLQGHLYVIHRKNGRTNSLLVTERCDNYCVMCSQPPKVENDDTLVQELLLAIPLIDKETKEVGITGGEPALLGERLVELLACMRDALPRTAVHVLSNGRRFADPSFARALAQVRHPDLMVGIPLYSDIDDVHDFVVQAKGAFDETIRGILNLKRAGIRVEIRFVIHQETLSSLESFARFVSRNLTFVDHVALMGLEPVGFAKTHWNTLWIDPAAYQPQLRSAIGELSRARIHVSIYNHQLCTLDPVLFPFAVASISDWKNEYFESCEHCVQKSVCGGFFSSARERRSLGVKPMEGPLLPSGGISKP